MKKIMLFIVVITMILNYNLTAQVSINNDSSSPDASAMLEVKSTNKGLLIPSMIEAQRNSINSPATGLLVYQTNNTNGFYYYDGSSWISVGAGVLSIDDLSDGKSDGSSVFLGLNTGSSDDGSNNNVGLGISTLFSNTSGLWNTAIGSDALSSNTTGNYNTASGKGALISNTSGGHNTATGVSSLYSNISGSGNTAMGSSALGANVGGASNSAFGYYSLRFNTSGNNNVAFGNDCLYFNTSGINNSVFGTFAMRSNTVGNNNTAIGYHANRYNEEGSNNTIFGFEAGKGASVHNKSGNIFLGYQAGYNETGDNKLYIENSNSSSPLIYGEFDSDLFRVNGTLDINSAYQFPTVDGTTGQVLTSDGAGLVNWNTANGDFSNGGESSGADRALGNTDNYALSFKTNSSDRLKIFNDGGIRFDGHIGIFTDPEPISSINKSINLYASGTYSNPHLKISGHNSGYIELESRRVDATSGKSWRIGSGSGSVADLDRFYIYNPDDGYCFMIRDGGNIGMGTTTPGHKLQIINNHNSEQGLLVTQNGTGDGNAATFEVSDASSSGHALNVYNSGSGYGMDLVIHNSGTGPGGRFTIDNSTNNQPTIYGEHNGLGNVGQFIASNSSNNSSALYVNNGGGGYAGEFFNNSGANSNATLYAEHKGVGNAARFKINNSASSSVGLYSYTNGTGPALGANNTGDGIAGFFNIIGTTNNNTALEVKTQGTGSAGKFEIDNTSSTDPVLLITGNGTGSSISADGTIHMTGFSLPTSASTSYVLTSDANGIGSWQAPSFDFANGGEIGGANRTLGNTDNYGLGFLTNNTNRFHIANDGNVGVGTTTPSELLEIKGGTASTFFGMSIKQNSAGGGYPSLFFKDHNDNILASIFPHQTATHLYFRLSSGDFIFQRYPSQDIHMVITDNGNVGIGTSTPGGILDIAGAYHFPSTDGTNGQVLKTNASGVLTWSDDVLFTIQEIDDLDDGKTGGNSVFLGESAGFGDNGSTNNNTAVGYESMLSNTNGYNNTAIGYHSLYSNTTGYYNTAIGYEALNTNTTGTYNTATGYQALMNNTVSNISAYGYQSLTANTSGYDNSAFGAGSLKTNTTGSYNTAVGSGALRDNSLGFNNTAAGVSALRDNTSGSGNTALGSSTLRVNKTGRRNVAIGFESMNFNNDGEQNIAIGYQTLRSNTSGDNNTVIGTQALQFNTASSNTALGYYSLHTNSSGVRNLGLGYEANYHNQTGSYNTIIGYQAGRGATYHNKSYNVFMGYQAGYNETGDNKLYIENSNSTTPLIYGEFDNDLVRINGTLDINNAYEFPASDGTNGQVLSTDGSGMVSWGTATDEFSDGGETGGADRTLGNTDNYGLGFLTNNTSRIHLTNDGNVGIGTTNPHGQFEVYKNSVSGTTVGDFVVDTDNKKVYVGRLSTTPYNSSDFIVRNRHGYETFVVSAANYISLGNYNGSNEQMRVVFDGNTFGVGIGTTTPDEKLHIAGNMRLDGTFEDKDGEAGSSGQILSSTGNGTDWVAPPINEFSDGGDAGGTDRTLGNTDNYDLSLLTNNTSRLKIDEEGGVRIDGHIGIFTDPDVASSINKSINLYASGTYSNPYLKISGHNSAAIDLISRRMDVTNGKAWKIASGSGSTADLDKFYISNTDDGQCITIRNGGNVGIGENTPSAKLDVNGTTGYNQLRLRTSYTPTSSSDTNGNIGDISWDDGYIYIKTSTGWKRTALGTF